MTPEFLNPKSLRSKTHHLNAIGTGDGIFFSFLANERVFLF